MHFVSGSANLPEQGSQARGWCGLPHRGAHARGPGRQAGSEANRAKVTTFPAGSRTISSSAP